MLDPDQLRKLVPDMHCDDFLGGLFGPSDGYIDGHLYCSILAEGLDVRPNTQLLGYEPGKLDTSKGTLEADLVVNAAGGWAGRVGEILGAPVPILPQRHMALVAHLPRKLDYTMPSVMDYIPATGDYGLYFRHESPEHLIAGLHTEEAIHDLVDPDNFGRSDEHDYMERVAEKFAQRLPGLAEARLGNVWAGLYPISPDGLPILGGYEGRDDIFTVAGAGGSGLQQSPALGRLAAEVDRPRRNADDQCREGRAAPGARVPLGLGRLAPVLRARQQRRGHPLTLRERGPVRGWTRSRGRDFADLRNHVGMLRGDQPCVHGVPQHIWSSTEGQPEVGLLPYDNRPKNRADKPSDRRGRHHVRPWRALRARSRT